MKTGSNASPGKMALERCSICRRQTGSKTGLCSISCAVAARIPFGTSALPATWELSAALGTAFILFNQFLFWFMAWAKRAQENELMSERFAIVSLVAGFTWLLMTIVVWLFAQPKRLADLLGPLFGIVVLWLGASLIDWPRLFPSQLAVFNFLISLQLYRGFLFLYLASKKREK